MTSERPGRGPAQKQFISRSSFGEEGLIVSDLESSENADVNKLKC